MLRLLARVLRGLPGYLWSGWGAAASLFLLLAAWEAVAAFYDPLILPAPLDAFAASNKSSVSTFSRLLLMSSTSRYFLASTDNPFSFFSKST